MVMLSGCLEKGGTTIPPGVSVWWAERQDRLQIAIETASVESAEVDLDDSGLVIVRLNTLEQPAAPEPEHGPTLSVHLQLFSEIDAARGRWKLSGRGVTLELTKSRVGRWNALVAGAAPASIKVDWSQYLDDEEEAELKSNPHVNKADMMRGAMGTDWGSNLDSHLAAQEQARRLDTSAHGDAAADDEISMYT